MGCECCCTANENGEYSNAARPLQRIVTDQAKNEKHESTWADKAEL